MITRNRPWAAWVCLAALVVLGSATSSVARPFDCTGTAPVETERLETLRLATLPNYKALFMTQAPGDDDRFFIVDQDGVIYLWKRGSLPEDVSVFLDLRGRIVTGGEQGLLGLAFPPDYAASGEFYVNFTAFVMPSVSTVVSRFSVDASDPDRADPNSEQRLLLVAQPDSNHNAGHMFFGGDGFLYIANGDGGGSGDVGPSRPVCGNGQALDTLLGVLMRIDVRGVDPDGLAPECSSGAANYTIPSDNPFVATPSACDEIWAYGLRNPWRFTRDAETDDLYVADVGQSCWEEINAVSAADAGGQNFGWRQMEGSHCFDPDEPEPPTGSCDPPGVLCGSSPSCNDPSLTLPVAEYGSFEGGAGAACSITGGYVYRGCRLPLLRGAYFYGDYCAGFVRSFRFAGGAATDPRDWTDEIFANDPLPPVSLTSFAQDNRGELYVVSRLGDLLKIVPEFEAIEVSGAGAGQSFLLRSDAWVWEDVASSSSRPVASYRVYRGTPNGLHECVHTTTETQWTGGDPDRPLPGEVFSYLVTAIAPDGRETAPGPPDTNRALSTAPCP